MEKKFNEKDESSDGEQQMKGGGDGDQKEDDNISASGSDQKNSSTGGYSKSSGRKRRRRKKRRKKIKSYKERYVKKRGTESKSVSKSLSVEEESPLPGSDGSGKITKKELLTPSPILAKRCSTVTIVTEGTKIIQLNSAVSKEEEENWTKSKSLSPDKSDAQSFQWPIRVTVDNSFRNTLMARPERLKIINGHLCSGWSKPIYKFHINRIQETARVIKKKATRHQFPNIRNLIIEAIHMQTSEKVEDDLAFTYSTAVSSTPAAVASEQEKNALLYEGIRFVALLLRTFSNLIEFYLKKCKEGTKQTADHLITDFVCIMKNISVDILDPGYSKQAWNAINVEEIYADLGKIVNMVELMEQFQVINFGGDEQALGAIDSSESPADIWPRVVNSYQKTRNYIASMLLRSALSYLPDVDKTSNFKVAYKQTAEVGFKIPTNFVKQAHTSGNKAETDAILIESRDWNSTPICKETNKMFYMYNAKDKQIPKEVMVCSTENKRNVFYVYNENGIATAQICTWKPGTDYEVSPLKTASDLDTAGEVDGDTSPVYKEIGSPNVDTDKASKLEAQQKMSEQTEEKFNAKTGEATAAEKQFKGKVSEVVDHGLQCSPIGKFLFPEYSSLWKTENMTTYLKDPNTKCSREEDASVKNLYNWAEETQKKYREIRKSNQSDKAHMITSFLAEQGHAKKRFWLEPSEREIELRFESKECRPPDNWDAVVAGWSHSTRMRWNHRGMRVEGMSTPDLTVTADQQTQHPPTPQEEQTSFYEWVCQVVKKALHK